MTAPAQKRMLTAAEVARICGVSERTLRIWVSAQHPRPFRRVHRGSRFFFPPQAFATWLAENEKHEELSRLNGYMASLEQDTRSPPRAAVEQSITGYERQRRRQLADASRQAMAADLGAAAPAPVSAPSPSPPGPAPATPTAPAAAPASWDIFAVRDNTARMYTQAVRMFVGAPHGEKIAHQKNANACADLLRKLELDCIEVAKQMRIVILVSDAERLVGRICARVKHDLMNLPHASAADLAAMTDPAQITAYLDERVTDALRHLADGLKTMETDDDEH